MIFHFMECWPINQTAFKFASKFVIIIIYIAPGTNKFYLFEGKLATKTNESWKKKKRMHED